MQRWHGLATILTMMTVRGAGHGMTALHGLFGRSHGQAIKSKEEKNGRESSHQDWLGKTHHAVKLDALIVGVKRHAARIGGMHGADEFFPLDLPE
jgi:hypothetical protein